MKTNQLKFFFFFSLLFLLLFSACQEEVVEITDPDNEETIAPNSNLANLMRNVASNDGSIDNIIDYANCLEVALPVTVTANGVTITIESITDFDALESILDAFSNDDDDVEITFPITVIFNNYTQLVINNQTELEAQIENCNDEDEEDDDMECIDFQFPIFISIYNTAFQVIDTVTIQDDETLYTFIENLEGGVLASINFPVTMLLANGDTVVVENNAEMEAAIEAAEDTCDEDDDYDWNDDDDCAEAYIASSLIECHWNYVTSLYATFVAEHFVFLEDGTAEIYNDVTGDLVTTGTWSLSSGSNITSLNLEFNLEPYASLNLVWEMISCDDDRFEFFNENNSLVLEQDCENDAIEDCNVNLAELEGLLLQCEIEAYTYDASDNILDENYLLFEANGEVIVNGELAVTEVGSWTLIETNSSYALTIGGLASFDLLNGEWLLLGCEEDAFIFSQETNSGNIIILELEQDCQDCNNPEVLINDLVIYMPFAEEAHDLISGFNTENVTNTFVEDRAGNSSCAIAFSGNDTLEIPVNTNSQLIQGDSFSISLWFKMQNTTAGDLELFFRSPGNATQGFQLGVYDLNTPLFADNTSFSLWDNDWNGEVDVAWENTNWHHLVLTVDADNTVRLYRDGVQRNIDENSSLNIGSQASDRYIIGEGFVGHLDDLRVYKRTLSPNEVGELFNLEGECYTCL
ncbi:LamG domain-containing protein [Lacinutrix sp. C3R15]|uniref:LamG domain-containing protein n=1 Tax=Flavobacteriaceae TaxID=49546 RepID=UPI001C08A5D4|nr:MULTISPECIES: LamG domain-containing protein [Flavobacteriaceae]MBU2941013.1 LamG domain-containing protein [Lacinutrix sp. C3R15]MDO6624332.1 LamG domain-containing protein [Oceanihabitans sp. 1_MG-2023]